MQTLKDLIGESKIFAQREVLSPHYTPEKLVFREKEISSIEKAIKPALEGEKGRNLFVYGRAGTGKTSCAKYVISEIKEIPNTKARVSYINCRMYNTRFRVLNKVIADHMPNYARRGYGTVDLYEKLMGWIEEDNKILILVLDEIDMVKDLDDLVYIMTRINSEIRAGGVAMIGISNKVSFKEELDPRSLSALNESELVFPSYYSDEIYEIIKARAEKGFKKGAISDEILHFIAASAAKEGGDARLSLKILSKSGELAEDKGKESVGMEEADEAVKMAESEIVYEVISSLPEHQKLVLYSIVLLAQSGGSYKKLTDGRDTYLFSGEVYNRYKSIAEGLKRAPKSERWYRNYISELEMQGLIASFDSSKGIRGHTKLIKLLYPTQKTRAVLERNIFGLERGKEKNDTGESKE
ncbi:MAG: AAA family ATPase [Candidatus Marsarchaeota archaeon]|nr:AAA family ATPase [Candidatus Marsarchaeota archaeon]